MNMSLASIGIVGLQTQTHTKLNGHRENTTMCDIYSQPRISFQEKCIICHLSGVFDCLTVF